MITPEEIKVWLATEIAVHYHLPNPEPRLTPKEFMFLEKMHGETLAYIERIESRLAQVERERDSAVEDLTITKSCKTCKNYAGVYVPNICMDCIECCNFEWRGVCAENTKEA